MAETDQQNTEVEEQPEGQADSGDSGVKETKVTGTEAADTDTEDEVDLIGQEKFDSLKDDPAALRKELNRAATKKFQSLSKERKELEPYRDLIRGLDESPRDTLLAVARQFGLDLVDTKATKGKTEAEVAESLDTRINAVVAKSLGPEYGDLADRLGPAIREVAKMVAGEQIQATEAKLGDVIADTAMREANQALESFGKKHPDWKDHEEAMTTLSARMPPGEGMDEGTYLENLYYLVTRDGSEGDTTKKVIKRMAKSVQNSSEEGSSVSSKNVSVASAKAPTFREAAAAAKRGERFE